MCINDFFRYLCAYDVNEVIQKYLLAWHTFSCFGNPFNFAFSGVGFRINSQFVCVYSVFDTFEHCVGVCEWPWTQVNHAPHIHLPNHTIKTFMVIF